MYNSKIVHFFSKMLLIVQKQKEWIYNLYFTKNFVTIFVGLKIAVKDVYYK